MGRRNDNIERDREGDFTYIEARDCSVIDYIIGEGDREEWNYSLEVRGMVGLDHLPLIYS